MTKILAIGDLHGNTSLAEKFAKQAKDENVDLVILAGDITLAEKSIENLIGPFAREKKQILLNYLKRVMKKLKILRKKLWLHIFILWEVKQNFRVGVDQKL